MWRANSLPHPDLISGGWGTPPVKAKPRKKKRSKVKGVKEMGVASQVPEF